MKSSNKTSQSKPIHNTYITNKIIIITQNKCLAQIFAAKQTPKDIIRVKMMQSPFNKEQKLMLKLFQNIREPLVTLPASPTNTTTTHHHKQQLHLHLHQYHHLNQHLYYDDNHYHHIYIRSFSYISKIEI